MSLSAQSQAVIDNFGRQAGVTPDQVNNLQQVLNDSPVLAEQFNAAVAQGHLRKIVPLSHPNAGGEYNGQDKSIHLPLAKLTTPPPGSAVGFHAGDMTFVLGHELQHGFNHAAKEEAYRSFRAEVTRVAKSDSPTHDYTAVIGGRIAADRHNEASAEIAGWNATMSVVKSVTPHPTLKDIYMKASGRMRDFIDVDDSRHPYTYSLKPNLKLNPDLTLSQTPANIEAMGQNYFDKTSDKAKLGHRGNSDYTNYYAASAISYAAQVERHHNPPRRGVDQTRMVVDMASLRLSEKLLEENGINLGRNVQPMPYHDLGTAPPNRHHFDHTATTHAHIPIVARVFEALQPANAPQQESHFFPRTATRDYLDAMDAAMRRGDTEACSALTQQHMQLPHMQEREAWGRELYAAEQQRLLEEQRRLEAQRLQEELERQHWLEQQRQQERSRGLSR